MATVRFSSMIGRRAEDIFDLLADVSRNPEWCPKFVDAAKVTAGPVGPDAAFRATMAGMGTLDMRITEYDRPVHLSFSATARSGKIQHGFVLTAGQVGTRVTQEIDVRPTGLLRVTAPLMARMLKRKVQANTAALKAFLEGEGESHHLDPPR